MTIKSKTGSNKSSARRRLLSMFGPGLVTGAADDDPSGIATYSQGGAQFGYAMSWTMFLTTPFMIAIQMVTARIGAVTGKGLAANLGKALPAAALYLLVGLLLIANTINIAADIAAMGDALRLVAGGPALVYVALFGIGCLAAQILVPFHRYSRYLKILTLALFAYVAAAFSVHVAWDQVVVATFIPRLSWDRDLTLMLVAIFGTTISPYMFFWQASHEAEDRSLRSNAGASAASLTRKRLALRDASRIRFDTVTGMIYSNLIGFFIIVTTGATLHAPWHHANRHSRTGCRSVASACRTTRVFPVLHRNHRHGAPCGAGAGGLGGLCRCGELRLARQPRITGAQRARFLFDRRCGDNHRPGRSFDSAQSHPDAVLERRGQRCRRRAADGRNDDRCCQPQNHGRVCRLAPAHDRRLGGDRPHERGGRGNAAYKFFRIDRSRQVSTIPLDEPDSRSWPAPCGRAK
jgi:Mn2+/Fe2+ NRAMP family transporter